MSMMPMVSMMMVVPITVVAVTRAGGARWRTECCRTEQQHGSQHK